MLSRPVSIKDGLVSGVFDQATGVTAYKGIPYAAPPIGNLRWHPPQPAAKWSEVRLANQFGASCLQKTARPGLPYTQEYLASPPFSEDCLYLNVWTTANSIHAHRPVLVWIHGGGFITGSGSVPIYDGATLAQKGIIVVTINYRLGVFGFYAHPQLTRESPYHSSGNYGLLDQIAALHWVKDNISAFGGDPHSVTVAGQSAGAASVYDLIASPLAKGLFARAIAESYLSTDNDDISLKDMEREGLNFAATMGAHSLAELRAMPAPILLSSSSEHRLGFGPIIDGWVLPRTVEEAVSEGKEIDVPILTGVGADEALVRPAFAHLKATAFKQQVHARFGPLEDRVFRLYPAKSNEETRISGRTLDRDLGLAMIFLRGQGHSKTSKTSFYSYYWDHPEPGPGENLYGAFHGSEVSYVFETLNKANRPWTPEDRAIANLMSAYWVNFVKTGNPNGPGLRYWPTFRQSNGAAMEFGNASSLRPPPAEVKIDLFKAYLAEHGKQW